MLRTHAGWLVQVAAVCACACGATNGSALGASSTDAGSTGVTGSPTEGGDPDGATCSDLSKAAVTAIGKAIASASANVACAGDSDCSVGPNGSDCSPACSGPITTTAGAAAIQSTIDEVNATTCATFKKDGCPPPGAFPCASGPMGVACVQGGVRKLSAGRLGVLRVRPAAGRERLLDAAFVRCGHHLLALDGHARRTRRRRRPAGDARSDTLDVGLRHGRRDHAEHVIPPKRDDRLYVRFVARRA